MMMTAWASAMNAASFEALYSAFSRMHVQKTWDGIMNAPVSLDDIVLAEMLWAAYKAIFTVTAILLVMLGLGIVHSPKVLVAWPVLLAAGITFSCIALIFNALAKGYDFFTYYFTLFLTPMMFLSGVFFPRFLMPEWLQNISAFIPLSPAIDGLRKIATEGAGLLQLGPELAIMAAWTVAIYFIAFRVFRWE